MEANEFSLRSDIVVKIIHDDFHLHIKKTATPIDPRGVPSHIGWWRKTKHIPLIFIHIRLFVFSLACVRTIEINHGISLCWKSAAIYTDTTWKNNSIEVDIFFFSRAQAWRAIELRVLFPLKPMFVTVAMSIEWVISIQGSNVCCVISVTVDMTSPLLSLTHSQPPFPASVFLCTDSILAIATIHLFAKMFRFSESAFLPVSFRNGGKKTVQHWHCYHLELELDSVGCGRRSAATRECSQHKFRIKIKHKFSA